MTTSRLAGVGIAAFLAAAAAPVNAGAAIQLQPVLSNLTNPIFVTNARDGSNRLFVVEQAGVIKVLQAGGTVPTVFLDIRSQVLSGGERGLLGLAFHPQFSSNRRFFVDYTRRGDGATVIAEYQVSQTDPNIAEPTGTALLVIAQPFTNHKGGMVEFGPDGFLYIGMGDGGSANDPGNRAQNINELLGKILRIDVDHPSGGLAYGIPTSNPFADGPDGTPTPGRDEIYAVGLRNPWRFSFDRATGQLYVGDVGQGAAEEIDIVTLGGNYGWRIWEGSGCTGNGPGLCSPAGFVFPIAQYRHTAGRCSVTGGYVYRGSQSTLPAGTYVYGDFCSGEIFMLQGGTSSVALDTKLSISSFGEDESGEIYVVGLGGTVHRLTGTVSCTFSLSPASDHLRAPGRLGPQGENHALQATNVGRAVVRHVPVIRAIQATGQGRRERRRPVGPWPRDDEVTPHDGFETRVSSNRRGRNHGMPRRGLLAPMLVGCLSVLGTVGPGWGQSVDKVQLQLKWVTQAQFAGYYAAKAKGLYAAESLDVTIRPGGPDIVPEQVVAGGGAHFGINWLPSLLSARDQGAPLVNIGQVFAHSGMREIGFKSSGIKGAADLRGRRVAVWFGGNEFELLATLEKYKIDRNRDVTLVPQPFDMNLLLQRKVDAAAAMTYNEYKQVLDAGVKAEDLVVIDFNREGTAMLEDGIFVNADWLRDAKNKPIAARFLRAALKGWEFCRDKANECVEIVLKESPVLGREHQTWMMAEINKLIWGPPPPRSPLGKMDPEAFKRTADIALKFGVIKKPADPAAYTHEIWELGQKK